MRKNNVSVNIRWKCTRSTHTMTIDSSTTSQSKILQCSRKIKIYIVYNFKPQGSQVGKPAKIICQERLHQKNFIMSSKRRESYIIKPKDNHHTKADRATKCGLSSGAYMSHNIYKVY